jgi:hypothetical protein
MHTYIIYYIFCNYIQIENTQNHEPINVPTAGAQAFLMVYTYKENGPQPTTRAQCRLVPTTANTGPTA